MHSSSRSKLSAHGRAGVRSSASSGSPRIRRSASEYGLQQYRHNNSETQSEQFQRPSLPDERTVRRSKSGTLKDVFRRVFARGSEQPELPPSTELPRILVSSGQLDAEHNPRRPSTTPAPTSMSMRQTPRSSSDTPKTITKPSSRDQPSGVVQFADLAHHAVHAAKQRHESNPYSAGTRSPVFEIGDEDEEASIYSVNEDIHATRDQKTTSTEEAQHQASLLDSLHSMYPDLRPESGTDGRSKTSEGLSSVEFQDLKPLQNLRSQSTFLESPTTSSAPDTMAKHTAPRQAMESASHVARMDELESRLAAVERSVQTLLRRQRNTAEPDSSTEPHSSSEDFTSTTVTPRGFRPALTSNDDGRRYDYSRGPASSRYRGQRTPTATKRPALLSREIPSQNLNEKMPSKTHHVEMQDVAFTPYDLPLQTIKSREADARLANEAHETIEAEVRIIRQNLYLLGHDMGIVTADAQQRSPPLLRKKKRIQLRGLASPVITSRFSQSTIDEDESNSERTSDCSEANENQTELASSKDDRSASQDSVYQTPPEEWKGWVAGSIITLERPRPRPVHSSVSLVKNAVAA